MSIIGRLTAACAIAMSFTDRAQNVSRTIALAEGYCRGLDASRAAIRHLRAKNLVLERQLEHARDAIAVLYVGQAARSSDGRVDVDMVIRDVLGES